jgi:arabinofuranosyltransferase
LIQRTVNYVVLSTQERVQKRTLYIFVTIGLVTLIIGTIHTSSLSFVNDDAFVSFRYAKNLIEGNGLVYNAGERVEGYTNFLWTVMIAGGMWLGIDPVTFSTILGIFFFNATLVLFIFLTWRQMKTGSARLFIFPLTAIALCINRDASVYATSGLETSMIMFLVAVIFAILSTNLSKLSLLFGGTVCVIAMMTRADAVVYYLAALAYLLISQKYPIRTAAYFLLPFIVLFVPFWLFRYQYYGYLFPNTFYAKSIDLSYYSQGITYVWVFLQTYYGFFLILPFGIYAAWQIYSKSTKPNIILFIKDTFITNRGNPQPILLASLLAGAYTFFVIRIGGDFMHARLLIPITPLLYFIMEQLIGKIEIRGWRTLGIALILITTLFRNDLFAEKMNVGYIVDEVRFYTPAYHTKEKSDGLTLHRYFDGLPVRVAFWASKLRLIYYADPAYALEASSGLTDATVAHQKLLKRGRPGHEKFAPFPYLQSKKIHFLFTPTQTVTDDQPSLTTIQFDSIPAQIVGYDNSIMERLRSYPEVQFTPMPDYLTAYSMQVQSYADEDIARDYSFFKSFYFDYNIDSTRQTIFASHIRNGNIK